MRGVPLLPEELRGAQEQPRPELPADHVAPLVEQQGQVAPRLQPSPDGGPDDRLGRRPDRVGLLQLAAAGVGDDRHLRREALHVVGLPLEQFVGDQ